MESIYNLTEKTLKNKLISKGFQGYNAGQVFDWLYKKRVKDFKSMSNLSKELRDFLKKNFFITKLKLIKEEASHDETRKFLFKLRDHTTIESVFIPEKERSTLCVSSQVGCKFRCKFCDSGKFGFNRNLDVSEIINQYLMVEELTVPRKVSNIVFMGIGEPLDNFSNTVKAIKILTNSNGVGFGKKRISISTAGITPAIEKLADLDLGVKLSISLHLSQDALRDKVMPINRAYPLKGLMAAAKYFVKKQSYPVTFEYILIRGLNTSKNDARKLSRLLKGIKRKLNLIPYNNTSNASKIPTQEEIDSFKEELGKMGLFSTLRKSRGQDINAACGQLRALFVRSRKR